jgi:antitoxin component YwqK of YwqJK toxin-antitoxin module
MEKLKNKTLVLLISFLIGTITCSCQDSTKKEFTQIIDTSKVTLIQTDFESFKLINKSGILMEGAIWDEKLISVSIIPLNDSLAEKLTYANSRVLISKRQMKLINGKYIEDGVTYHFNNNGILSHKYKYTKGLLIGEAIFYYNNGMIESKGAFINGDKTGIWEFYDETGKLIKKEVF